MRLQLAVLNFPESTEAHKEECRQRIRNHIAQFGDEGTYLSPHSSDSTELAPSMSSAEEAREVRGRGAEELLRLKIALNKSNSIP